MSAGRHDLSGVGSLDAGSNCIATRGAKYKVNNGIFDTVHNSSCSRFMQRPRANMLSRHLWQYNRGSGLGLQKQDRSMPKASDLAAF